MRHYILLLFDFDDEVVAVRTISAGNADEAQQIAQDAGLAHGRFLGYQLWQQGKRIAARFPNETKRARSFSLFA